MGSPPSDGFRVAVHVYDLSQGLARQLSLSLLGKSIEAIYHTGVVIYGNEYSFGAGIEWEPAGATRYGQPIQVLEFGTTEVSKELFEDFLGNIQSRYTADTYNLLRHNCNNFSDEVVEFLVGRGLPQHILHLPMEVMNTPFGQSTLVPLLEQMEMSLRSGPGHDSIHTLPQQSVSGRRVPSYTEPTPAAQILLSPSIPSSTASPPLSNTASIGNALGESQASTTDGIMARTASHEGSSLPTISNSGPEGLRTPSVSATSTISNVPPPTLSAPTVPAVQGKSPKTTSEIGSSLPNLSNGILPSQDLNETGEARKDGTMKKKASVERRDEEEEGNAVVKVAKVDEAADAEAAKAKVQGEISREFAAVMAAGGGLKASEAAALAVRRVMERHAGKRRQES
eukprot:TRINITY_DN22890_c0_g1_i1.p1 TRINITY_DN22890_c0_g1~~TRINITY_DN22890_c0_g1_i1.p1  ORF type:complete len:397 (+),score=61.51 TRINITY_DN22890_c0_g1_i1:775-1965(+)